MTALGEVDGMETSATRLQARITYASSDKETPSLIMYTYAGPTMGSLIQFHSRICHSCTKLHNGL